MSTGTFRKITFATVAATYVLMVVGGLVSATGAGLACPDWPLCHGQIIPPLEGPILLEWGHRVLASIVGILVLLTAIGAYKTRGQHPGLVGISVATLVLVLFQAVLGGLTVLTLISPALRTAHLALALIILANLLYITISAQKAPQTVTSPDATGRTPAVGNKSPFARRLLITTIATYILVVIGGFVSSTGAALACPDWPLCHGQIIPPLQGPIAMHFIHRVAALGVGVLMISLVLTARKTQAHQPLVLKATHTAAGLFLVQVLLGAANVLFRLPVAVVTAHLAVAAAIFAALVTAGFLTLQASSVPAHTGKESVGHEKEVTA